MSNYTFLIFNLCPEPIAVGGRCYYKLPVKGFGDRFDRQLCSIDLKLSWISACGRELPLNIFLHRVVVWGRSKGYRLRDRQSSAERCLCRSPLVST